MECRFSLSWQGKTIACPEPIGWRDLRLRLKRDRTWHGMRLENALDLGFYTSETCALIRQAYQAVGATAEIAFWADVKCNTHWQRLFTGKLDLLSLVFEEAEKRIRVNIVENSPREQLMARFSTPINLLQDVGLDGQALTHKANVPYLGYELSLHGQTIEIGTGGANAANSYTHGPYTPPSLSTFYLIWQLDFAQGRYDELKPRNRGSAGQIGPATASTLTNFPLAGGTSPQLSPLFVNDSGLTQTYRYRFSCDFTLNYPESLTGYLVDRMLWKSTGNLDTSSSIVENTLPAYSIAGGPSGTFAGKMKLAGTVTLAPNECLYAIIIVEVVAVTGNQISWVLETTNELFYLKQEETLVASTCKAITVHEALKRLVDSLTVSLSPALQSDVYGRTDIGYAENGYGSWRALTRGKAIRGNPEAALTFSLEEVLQGLQAIDNVGFGVLGNEEDGFIVRIEPTAFFYDSDLQLLTCDSVAGLKRKVNYDSVVTNLTIGYETWESEFTNGQDEVNSDREYALPAARLRKNERRIVSAFVTSGYAIERMRRAPYSEYPTQDEAYDNHAFLIALDQRTPNLTASEDGLRFSDANGLISPSTRYNLSLTPARNLRRWLPMLSIGQPTGSLLKFCRASANAQATSLETSGATVADCSQQIVIGEAQDIMLDNDPCVRPLFKPEVVEFEYPLTLTEYLRIRSQPYGLVRFRVADEPYDEGFLLELNYQPAKELATFQLLPRA
jgi:hypothetical protein